MNRKYFFLLLTFTLATVTFAFAQKQGKSENDNKVEQRILNIIDLEHEYNLDPHTASYSSEAQIFTGLYEGLFSYDPATLEPVNAICESYKISRDKKRWTFTLKEGAKFSDGSAISASTFRDSWINLLGTKNAPFASLLDCVEGAYNYRIGKGSAKDVRITARDAKTLVLHLTEPTEHLPRILCHHAFAAVSSKKNVYSGPFTLKSYSNGKLEMVKNPKYREASAVQLPGISITQSDKYAENTHLYNIGDADWVTGSINAKDVLNTDAIHVAGEFGTTYLFFKGTNSPWNRQDFRLALLEAIPYEELRKSYAVKASTFVYPLSLYPSVTGWDDFDAEDAKDLMDKARTAAGIAKDKRLPLVFAILKEDYIKDWAETLKKAWAPLGVDLITIELDAASYNSSIASTKADLFFYSWIGDFADPTAFLELFRGNSTLNVAAYKNSKFDDLLAQAAVTRKSADRFSLLADAEQVLLDDGEVIPIAHPISLHVINTDLIGGWKSNALDLHPFKYLYIKATKTSKKVEGKIIRF